MGPLTLADTCVLIVVSERLTIMRLKLILPSVALVHWTVADIAPNPGGSRDAGAANSRFKKTLSPEV